MHFPAALLSTTLVLAPLGARADAIPDGGLSLPRPAGLPDRLYAGDVYTTGGSYGHVIIVEGDDASRPARWIHVDDNGDIAWQSDQRCPDFRNYAMLVPPEPGAGAAHAVCKVGNEVIGVDLASGKEAWRFTDPRPLYMTVRSGDRLAVSVDNAQVAVLDVVTGKELMRFDVAGGVLEAATRGPKGPIALLVQDSEDAPQDTIELPVGENHALERVPLAGDDPGRRLVAIDIGGPARRGVVKAKALWSVPFEGYSFDVEPTLGAIVCEPSDGRVTAYDPANGKVLWERPEPEGEERAWGNEGGAFARPLSGGGILYGAFDGRLGKTAWDRTLDVEGPPLGLGAGDGDLGLVWGGGFRIVDFKTGNEKLHRTLLDGERLAALRTTAKSVAWVVVSGDTRALQFARP